jgi:hypothetical protein
MKGKYSPYTLNVDLFNETYKSKGGLQKFIDLRLEGKSNKALGEYFGFTLQRAHQICHVLEDTGLVPAKDEIESRIVKKMVSNTKKLTSDKTINN